MAKRESRWVRLGDYIKQIDRWNTDLKYGLDDIRGVSNTKQMMPTKANMEGRDLSTFQVLMPGEFIFNRRTTRNGERIGLGYNMDDHAYIFTEDYVSFTVKEGLLPTYLYLFFCRDEFDRYVRYHSWGSATEFFNWEEMCEVKIPLPFIDDEPDVRRQQEVVDAWQGLRKMKEQNEQLAEPLFQLCRSYMEKIKQESLQVPLHNILEPYDKACGNNKAVVSGVNIEKEFIESHANLANTDISMYSSVLPYYYATNLMHIGRDERLPIAINHSGKELVVTNAYSVFKIKDDKHNVALEEYVFLFFMSKNTDRLAWFYTDGSVRGNLQEKRFLSIEIPLPDLATQQAIVNIYHCAEEAKRIAAEADKLSREICPALMQHIIHEAEKNN